MLTSELIDSSLPAPPPITNIFRNHIQILKEDCALSKCQKQSSTSAHFVREHLLHIENETWMSADINKKKFIQEMVPRVTSKNKDDVWMQKIRIDDMSYVIQNSMVKPMLQIGPSCGIAALSMALNILTGPHNLDLPEFQQILEASRSLGFTYHGEMFSAQALLDLALKLSPNISGFLISKDVSYKTKKELILKHLIQKHVVLMPYDKGPNNEPILKNGLKAHWAVLTGLLITTSELSNNLMELLDVNQNGDNIFSFNTSINIDHIVQCLAKDYSIEKDIGEDHELFICARQGKSLRLHLWHLNELLDSNDQLLLNPLEDCYMLPEGGVSKGLCGQFVILKKICI